MQFCINKKEALLPLFNHRLLPLRHRLHVADSKTVVDTIYSYRSFT